MVVLSCISLGCSESTFNQSWVFHSQTLKLAMGTRVACGFNPSEDIIVFCFSKCLFVFSNFQGDLILRLLKPKPRKQQKTANQEKHTHTHSLKAFSNLSSWDILYSMLGT